MLHRDVFEQLAIERRRRNEEERKKRIFDPKMRIKGVDFAAIPEQIKEKEDKRQIEKEREEIFALQCKEINQLLEKIDHDIKLRKWSESQKLNQFRKNQKKEDPLVPRVPIDESKPHVSNCQAFVGDDLDKKERTHQQHEQMKVWIMDQVWQREENKRRQQQEEKEFKEYQDQLIKSLDEIEHQRQELIMQRNKRDAEHNLRLAAFKKLADYHEMEDRVYGHAELLKDSKLGSLMYETPQFIRRDGKILTSEYKGMTEQQIKGIRDYQISQIDHHIQQKQDEEREEKEYAEYQKQIIYMQDLLDAKKREIQKEQVRLQEQVNDVLRNEFKKRNQKVIDTSLQPFFSSFNQSSR